MRGEVKLFGVGACSKRAPACVGGNWGTLRMLLFLTLSIWNCGTLRTLKCFSSSFHPLTALCGWKILS